MAAVLIDTTILFFAFVGELDDPRTAAAQDAIERAVESGNAFICVQNLAELAELCLARATPPVTAARLREIIAAITNNFDVLWASPQTLNTAIQCVEQQKLTFWDAMIWAVAKEHKVPLILTEGMKNGDADGIAIRNPLP